MSGLTGFGFSGVAFADAAVTKMNPQIQDIGADLRCPTCGGLSIVESSSAQSLAMRAEIESQLIQGKSKSDILRYFTDRYGEWIMRKPDFQSKVGFFVWVIPIAGLIFGPLILIFGLKKSRNREMADLDSIRNAIEKFVLRGQA